MLPQVVALSGAGPAPLKRKLANGAITAGMLLILDNSGDGIGQAKEFRSSDGSFTSAALEGGLLGVAAHAAADGEIIHFWALTPVSPCLAIDSYGSAPSETLMGVAQATLYCIQRDSGVAKLDLATITNGVARLTDLTDNDDTPFSDVRDAAGGIVPSYAAQAVGDRVLAHIPESMRHYR